MPKHAIDSGRIILTKAMVNDAANKSADVIINAAITTLAAAGGGVIELGPGDWVAKAPIRMPQNKFLAIQGDGTGAAGNIFGSRIAKATPGGFTLFEAIGDSESSRVLFELRDLELSGNYQPGMVADISRASHMKLHNVRFARGATGAIGVQFREVWDSHGTNTIFENLGDGTAYPAVLFGPLLGAAGAQDMNSATVHFTGSIFQGNNGTDLKLAGDSVKGVPTNDIRFTNTKMESGTGSYPFIDDDFSQSCVFTALSISNPTTRTGVPIIKGTTGLAAGGRRGTSYVGLTINTSIALPRFIDHQAGVLNIAGAILTGSPSSEMIRVGNGVPLWGFNLTGYSGGRDVPVVNDLRQSPRYYSKGSVNCPVAAPGSGSTATAGMVNAIPYLNFDQATEQEARFGVVIPADARPGEKVMVALTYYSNSATGAVKWRVSATESLSPEAGLNGSIATALTNYDVTHTPGQGQIVQRVVLTAGVVRPGNVLGFKVTRVAADAADTLPDNARLLGVSVLYEREF